MSDINSMLDKLRDSLADNDALKYLWAPAAGGVIGRCWVIHMPAGFIVVHGPMSVSVAPLKRASLLSENVARTLAPAIYDGNLTRGKVMTMFEAVELEDKRLRELIQVMEQALAENSTLVQLKLEPTHE